MKIPKHIQKVINNQDLHILATSKDGAPNVIYLKFLKVYNDEQVLVADNKFCKTDHNLQQNPYASFVVFDRQNHKSYQLKGRAEFHTNDEVFKDCEKWVLEKRPHNGIYPKSAVLINIKEIYAGAEKIEG